MPAIAVLDNAISGNNTENAIRRFLNIVRLVVRSKYSNSDD